MIIMLYTDLKLHFFFEFITDTDASKSILISFTDECSEVVPNALTGGVPHSYVEFVNRRVVLFQLESLRLFKLYWLFIIPLFCF